jgi:hypothetical protein
MADERALIGIKEIAKYLRWSESKVQAHSKRMKESGVIIRQCFGRPPHRSVRLYTFPSILQRYLMS